MNQSIEPVNEETRIVMSYPAKYVTQNDKHEFVDILSFGNTCTELLEKLRQLSNDGYFFRGQRDALWPIVSTGQRAYIEHVKNDCNPSIGYLDFLCKALEYAKRECEFAPKKGVHAHRDYYDHEIWGWLQHYSYPTPFIDFSRDYKVALYMATAHVENSAEEGCFSIYAIPKQYEIGNNENIRLEKLISANRSAFARTGLSKEEMFRFDNWKDFGFCLIHKDGSLKPWDKNLAKERIASQDGLFVYLNDATLSVEEYYNRQNKMRNGGVGVGCILPRIKCIDVPNDMAPLVKVFCKREGYTAEYLGLADQSEDDCMKCIRSRFLKSL